MDYFKTLWSRFKKQSKLIDNNSTIYYFRHSGAIYVFKRTGSITKLQKAMGHSSINVSLTYLRRLEVPELTEGDMPELKVKPYTWEGLSCFYITNNYRAKPAFIGLY